MEKKKNILITLLVVIMVLLIGLVVLLVYDKISIKDVDSDISQNDNIVLDEDEENENNTEDDEDSIDNDSLIPDDTDNSSDEEIVEEDDETETPSEPVTSTPNETTGKTSSKENPLTIGEWGVASKYIVPEYVDVPARVTNVTRGSAAAQEYKNYLENKSSIYKYSDPKESMEWAIIEYEIDLTKVDKQSSQKLSTKVSGLGNSSTIKYNGKSYIVTSMDMNPNDDVSGKIVTCKFAVQLPIGCSDYIIELGTYNETQAFFKGK